MNEFRAKLDRMRGKCVIREYTTANSITRFKDEDVDTCIAEFARSGKTCRTCAYHQRCHESTCLT
jgi:hypothetical protein